MLYTPNEVLSNFKVPSLGVGVAIFCTLGLLLELSRPNSPIGWALRDIKDGLYESTHTSNARKSIWKKGLLTISEQDIDVLVRTTIGEAALEPDEGKVAVAWVIMNRARQNISWYGGNNVADVALHKATKVRGNGRTVTVWQFEPWMTRKDYLWSIPKHSAIYQHTKRLIIGCINGTHADPTYGATHFLEPNIVRSRTGGTLPKWAQGNGRKIGRHVFFKPNQPTV